MVGWVKELKLYLGELGRAPVEEEWISWVCYYYIFLESLGPFHKRRRDWKFWQAYLKSG